MAGYISSRIARSSRYPSLMSFSRRSAIAFGSNFSNVLFTAVLCCNYVPYNLQQEMYFGDNSALKNKIHASKRTDIYPNKNSIFSTLLDAGSEIPTQFSQNNVIGLEFKRCLALEHRRPHDSMSVVLQP